MRRVELLGPPGVGKTTLAKALHWPQLAARSIPRGVEPTGPYQTLLGAVPESFPRAEKYRPGIAARIGTASWIAEQDSPGVWLLDESLCQAALLLILLRAPDPAVDAYVRRIPTRQATVLYCEASAEEIERRGIQRGIVETPGRVRLAVRGAHRIATALQTHGADVRRVDMMKPIEETFAEVRAILRGLVEARLVITPRPFDEYVQWLLERRPFAFSRWGDGEWSAVMGRGHANCDGQQYTPELRKALAEILTDRPPYLMALQGLAIRRFGPQIEDWLTLRGLWFTWEDSDVWHRFSRRGKLQPLVDALKTRRILMVGPARLRPIRDVFPYQAFVEIPERNAHAAIGQIRTDLAAGLQTLGPDGVVALSAGMTANVLIHDYCARTPVAQAPRRTTWIDFGAVWEPYVGVACRTYHQEVLARLGGPQ